LEGVAGSGFRNFRSPDQKRPDDFPPVFEDPSNVLEDIAGKISASREWLFDDGRTARSVGRRGQGVEVSCYYGTRSWRALGWVF
jgi:hypothetical protein